MNNELFQHARSAYVTKDFEAALTQFTDCLQDAEHPLEPGEMGLLYHQIGNCLVKLHDPAEAIHAYSQAILDQDYDSLGAVNYNLGMVYASQHDYEAAVNYFKDALADEKYPTPFKAHQALGNSLLKLGKSAEAGAAFRTAALDERNPDPTRALLNLGVCFMALNRPMDAVASYESALQFDMTAATRNKLFANMGQAYVAAGKMEKAVHAFETALSDKTYVFNDAANVDYQRAVAAVAAGITDESENAPEADLSGLDVSSDGVALDESSDQETTVMAPVTADQHPADEFFAKGEGFQDWGQVSMKKKRRHRGIKIFIAILIVLIALVGAGFAVVTQGLGYPTKTAVVEELFSDAEGADVYSADIDDAKKARIADMVVDGDITVKGESNQLMNAKVYVTAVAEGGSEVPYEVTMVRDGIGWKVSNVALYFASQQN